jgi:hypothetical protein
MKIVQSFQTFVSLVLLAFNISFVSGWHNRSVTRTDMLPVFGSTLNIM